MTESTAASPVDFYLTESLLAPEERAVRDRVRQFAEEHVRPVAREAWEREAFPRQLLPELAKLGIAGSTVAGHGCPGLSPVAAGLAMQELARVDSSFGTFFAVSGGFVPVTIAACGSEEQKARWLPRLARVEAIGAFALTEPEHGSDAWRADDAGDPRRRQLRPGRRQALDRQRDDLRRGRSSGLAPRMASPGSWWNRPLPGSSRPPSRARCRSGERRRRDIRLEGCRVPAANRLPRGGFGAVAEMLGVARHGAAWHALGEAIACYEIARDYALRREQFGKPLAAFQLVQAKLVRMLGEITKAQLLAIQLGRVLERGEATPGMTALAKLSNTAMAREVAATAREILGGNGILQDHEVMRHLCDLEAVYTYEGTFDINTLIVGREITGIGAFS